MNATAKSSELMSEQPGLKQEMQQSTYYGDDIGIKLDTAFEENFKQLSKKVKNLPQKKKDSSQGIICFPTREEQMMMETNTKI